MSPYKNVCVSESGSIVHHRLMSVPRQRRRLVLNRHCVGQAFVAVLTRLVVTMSAA
jgi:hypothetical protein